MRDEKQPKLSKPGSKRYEAFMPNNLPRWIRCYDQGEGWDRYTIVFTSMRIREMPYIGMTAGGSYYHGSADSLIDRPTYGHLGKKVTFSSLPLPCQQTILREYGELRDIDVSDHPIIKNWRK